MGHGHSTSASTSVPCTRVDAHMNSTLTPTATANTATSARTRPGVALPSRPESSRPESSRLSPSKVKPAVVTRDDSVSSTQLFLAGHHNSHADKKVWFYQQSIRAYARKDGNLSVGAWNSARDGLRYCRQEASKCRHKASKKKVASKSRQEYETKACWFEEQADLFLGHFLYIQERMDGHTQHHTPVHVQEDSTDNVTTVIHPQDSHHRSVSATIHVEPTEASNDDPGEGPGQRGDSSTDSSLSPRSNFSSEPNTRPNSQPNTQPNTARTDTNTRTYNRDVQYLDYGDTIQRLQVHSLKAPGGSISTPRNISTPRGPRPSVALSIDSTTSVCTTRKNIRGSASLRGVPTSRAFGDGSSLRNSTSTNTLHSPRSNGQSRRDTRARTLSIPPPNVQDDPDCVRSLYCPYYTYVSRDDIVTAPPLPNVSPTVSSAATSSAATRGMSVSTSALPPFHLTLPPWRMGAPDSPATSTSAPPTPLIP